MLGAVSQLHALPSSSDGLAEVRATLRCMVALVRKYKADAGVRTFTARLLRRAGITDTRSQRLQAIQAVQSWVRDHIAYVHDPQDVEMIQTPPQTLTVGSGDCDDQSILVATMLASVGFNTEFLAVGGSGHGWGANDGSQFSHVLAAVQYGPRTGRVPPYLDGWLTLETIIPGVGPGWMPPGTRVIMPARV